MFGGHVYVCASVRMLKDICVCRCCMHWDVKICFVLFSRCYSSVRINKARPKFLLLWLQTLRFQGLNYSLFKPHVGAPKTIPISITMGRFVSSSYTVVVNSCPLSTTVSSYFTAKSYFDNALMHHNSNLGMYMCTYKCIH